MRVETLKGEIETVNGKKLTDLGLSILKYEGPVELWDTPQEAKDKSDWMSDEDILNAKNTQRKNARRQKLMADTVEAASEAWKKANSTTDGDGKVTVKEGNPFEKPTLANSEDMRYKNIYDALLAKGKSPEEAKRITEAALA